MSSCGKREQNIRSLGINFSGKQLLIFKPNDGWEPICKLLNVPIPTVPYPSTNNRKAFLADKNQWRSEAVPA